MNNPTQPDEILEYFKAMVDVDRLRMAGMLAITPLTKEQMVDRLNLPLREVVNHLAFLEHLAILRRDGQSYTLDEAAVQALARRNLAGRRPAHKEEDLPEDEYDRKVVHDFTNPDGTIKSLPTQQKKFLSILRYVAQSFEPATGYPEKEVNLRLRRFHEDTASLRRGMVDFGLMQRQSGVYTKVKP